MHICRCCCCCCCVCVLATTTTPPAGELFLYFLCVFYALLLRLLMNYAVTALPLHHAAQLRPVSLYLCRSFIVSVFVCVRVCAWRAFAFTQNSTRTALSLPPSHCVCLRHKNRIFIAFQFVIVYHTHTHTDALNESERERDPQKELWSDRDSYTSVCLCVCNNFLLVFSAVFSVLFSCCYVVDGGLVGVVSGYCWMDSIV